MSSVPTTAGNVLLVTHVQPLPQHAGQQLPVCNQKFNKGQPQALGTVQIMIGLMIILFGIAMLFYEGSLAVYSGIFIWGAVLYIVSGSLTVAAGRSVKRCLLVSSLVLNIISAIVSVAGVIMYSLDTVIWRYYRIQGFSGVLAVFQFLELVIAIIAAGFACPVSSCCGGEPQVIVASVDGSLTPQVFQAAPTQAIFQPAPTQAIFQAAPTQAIFQTAPAQIPTQVLTIKNSEDAAAAAMPPAYDANN